MRAACALPYVVGLVDCKSVCAGSISRSRKKKAAIAGGGKFLI